MEFRADASPPGLYATKAFGAGDVIIDEAPLFVFRPLSSEDDKAVSSQFKNVTSDPEAATKKAAAAANSGKKKGGKKKKKGGSVKFVASLDDIQCPSHVDLAYAGKFRAMVMAAATYSHGRGIGAINDDTRSRILSLYAPNIENPGDDERAIVSTACAALKYCRDNAVDESNLSKLVKTNNETQRECLQIMLIWSCNAFEGGMLYEQTSRIIHSCDANGIVRESPNAPPSASAAAAAAASKDGDDDDNVPNRQPVQQQVVATSSIKAGDEITISYLGIFGYAGGTARLDQLRKTKNFTCRCSRCTSTDRASAVPCPSCQPRVNGRYLDEEVQYDDDKTVKYCHPKNAESASQSMQCQQCGETTSAANVMTMVNKVCDKVTARLERTSSASGATRSDDDEDPTDAEQEMDEQLFHLASSVLGAKHWTTNLMALSMLNMQLSAIHAATLMGGSPPDLTELAECIDTLQRLWDYVNGLELKADSAHLLCGPTIGIARALVSLGDIKSRKYAAEWIEKVEEYVRKFEVEGMVKVVEALKEAWKRDDLEAVTNEDMEGMEEEEDMGSNKRARIS